MTNELIKLNDFNNQFVFILLLLTTFCIVIDGYRAFKFNQGPITKRLHACFTSNKIFAITIGIMFIFCSYLGYSILDSFSIQLEGVTNQQGNELAQKVAKRVKITKCNQIEVEKEKLACLNNIVSGKISKVTRISDGFFQTILVIFASIFSFSLKVILDAQKKRDPVLLLEFLTLMISLICILICLTAFQWNSALTDEQHDGMKTAFPAIFSLFFSWWVVLIGVSAFYYFIWSIYFYSKSHTTSQPSSTSIITPEVAE